MIEFVDTHTHIFEPEFAEDRAAAVERAVDAGVKTLCLPCINESSLERMDEMCREFPGICHAMIGLHRWTFVGKVVSLLSNMLSRLVMTFLPRS